MQAPFDRETENIFAHFFDLAKQKFPYDPQFAIHSLHIFGFRFDFVCFENWKYFGAWTASWLYSFTELLLCSDFLLSTNYILVFTWLQTHSNFSPEMAKSNKSSWNNPIILVHRVPSGQCPCVVLFGTIQQKRMQIRMCRSQMYRPLPCTAYSTLMTIPFYCSRHSDAFWCVYSVHCALHTHSVYSKSANERFHSSARVSLSFWWMGYC